MGAYARVIIAEGRLKNIPKISPVNNGFMPKLTFGMRKPIIKRSTKAALKASHFFRLLSKLMGIIIKTATIPKTKPQIIPKVIASN